MLMILCLYLYNFWCCRFYSATAVLNLWNYDTSRIISKEVCFEKKIPSIPIIKRDVPALHGWHLSEKKQHIAVVFFTCFMNKILSLSSYCDHVSRLPFSSIVSSRPFLSSSMGLLPNKEKRNLIPVLQHSQESFKLQPYNSNTYSTSSMLNQVEFRF